MNDIGIVLFAHGSRDDRWREPVEAVARRLSDLDPSVQV
ncbi:MAG: cobalamin biosynthesis protein CbiX, partial [Polaromonas sp.]|nr:cobalamin biosynthesis protein CbiX [Polaromonas sp.]